MHMRRNYEVSFIGADLRDALTAPQASSQVRDRGALPSFDRTSRESSTDGAQSASKQGSKGGTMRLASRFLKPRLAEDICADSIIA